MTLPPTCKCEAAYAGTIDCSQPTLQLFPEQTLNITVDPGTTRQFHVIVSDADAKAHQDMMVIAIQTNGVKGADSLRLYTSPISQPTTTDYWYASPIPLSNEAQLVVPHGDLWENTWFFMLDNEDLVNQAVVFIDLVFEGWCPCSESHGTCSVDSPAICTCNSGYQGAACDVKTGDTGDVPVGTVVAVVIVLFGVGIAFGILIKRQKPDLCSREHRGNESLRIINDE